MIHFARAVIVFFLSRKTPTVFADLPTEKVSLFLFLFQGGTDVKAFYDVEAYTVKQADQAILMIIFGLTFSTFLAQILFGFRYKYSWHRLSVAVSRDDTKQHLTASLQIGFLCLIYACAPFGVSVVVAVSVAYLLFSYFTHSCTVLGR